MGCVHSKRKTRRVAPLTSPEKSTENEVTIVEKIHLPLELQPAMEEPRTRDNEKDVLSRLKDEGLLKSETIKETINGKSFYVSLDGNPFPFGKPRLLEPIELTQEREKLKAQLNNRMVKATRNRRQSLATVERRARLTSAKVRQAKSKEDERRQALKERIGRKMEQAARNRLLSRGK